MATEANGSSASEIAVGQGKDEPQRTILVCLLVGWRCRGCTLCIGVDRATRSSGFGMLVAV